MVWLGLGRLRLFRGTNNWRWRGLIDVNYKYENKYLVVYGFSISALVYCSRYVYTNISLVQGAKGAHNAGSNCSDLDVCYIGLSGFRCGGDKQPSSLGI